MRFCIKVYNQHFDSFGKNYKNEGLVYGQNLNFKEWFGNDNPIIIEIGFGTGTNLIHCAKLFPNKNFIGK